MISPSRVQAMFIRHPETAVQGQLSKGQKDYPLDEKGEKQSDSIAQTASKLGPKIIFSSPLKRATVPARKLAAQSGATLKITPKLLPWDFGKLAGRPENKTEPILRDLWKNHPDDPAGDNGESFNQSLERERGFVSSELKPAIESGLKPAVVFHSRQSRQLPHLLQNKPTADPTKGGLPPAGIETFGTDNKFKRVRRIGPA